MQRALLASFIALSVSACAYRPTPEELIHTVDSPADVRVCTRLGEVSPTVSTTPGFRSELWSMQNQVVALGGTHLYLQRQSPDWALVKGVAYRCGPGAPRETTVIRAKG